MQQSKGNILKFCSICEAFLGDELFDDRVCIHIFRDYLFPLPGINIMSDAASHCVCMKNLLWDSGVAPCRITTVVHAWAGHNSKSIMWVQIQCMAMTLILSNSQ